MRRGPLLILSIASLAAGCVHEHRVSTLRPVATPGETIAELADGRRIAVRTAPADDPSDSARWMTVEPAGAIVDDATITSYTTVNRRRGAIEGMFMCGLGGVAIGAPLGLAAGDSCSGSSSCFLHFSRGVRAVTSAAILGGIGAAVCGVLGYRLGSRDVYKLNRAVIPEVSACIDSHGADAALTWSF